MTSKSKVIKAIFRVYLEIVRIMPQMALLFVVYFGTTRVFGWNISAEISAIIVFVFWGTAEMGDLVRGAIISIPKIQYESAQAMAMLLLRRLIRRRSTRRSLWPYLSSLNRRIMKSKRHSRQPIGMETRQVYMHVILPQTIRRLLPLSINLITRMIKTTSLIMMIGIVEVLKVAQQIIEANRNSSPNAAFGVFLVVLLMYFIICWPISRLAGYLEKRWSKT